MKRIISMLTILFVILAGLAFVAGPASAADTCVGYEHKVELPASPEVKTVTITPTSGEIVTEWCVKFSTQLRTGTGNVIDISDQQHAISHYAWNDAPEPTKADTYRDVPQRLENCAIAGVKTWTDRYTTTYKWDGTKFVGTETGPVRIDETFTAYTDAEYKEKCAPSQPADKVVYSEWKDGTWKCGDTTVTQTRTVTTTPYVWDSAKREWVEGASTTTTETRTRPLTGDEAFPCPNPPPPVPPTDVCPNLPGNQSEVPPGHVMQNGNCVLPPPPPPTPQPPVDHCPNMDGHQPVGSDCDPDETPPPADKRKPKAAIRAVCTGLVGYVLNNTKSNVAVTYKYLNDGKVKKVVVKAGKKKVFSEKAKAHSVAWIKAKGMTTVKTRVPGSCSVPPAGL